MTLKPKRDIMVEAFDKWARSMAKGSRSRTRELCWEAWLAGIEFEILNRIDLRKELFNVITELADVRRELRSR